MIYDREMFIEMLRMQDTLNVRTSGMKWKDGVTDKGKPIMWYAAIITELSELIDSFPWKHWKDIDSDPDINNMKMELVDVWHFIMSEAIAYKHKVSPSLQIEDIILELAEDVADELTGNEYLSIEAIKDCEYKTENVVKYTAGFLGEYVCKEGNYGKLFVSFFAYMKRLGFDFRELYTIYLSKNVLNIFRQDHGYKEGAYMKTWGDVEDNVVCMELIEEYGDIDAKDLYTLLENEYFKVTRGF